MTDELLIGQQKQADGVFLVQIMKNGKECTMKMQSYDRLNESKPLSDQDIFAVYYTLSKALSENAQHIEDWQRKVATDALEAIKLKMS
jgi:hypothetical protein